MNQPTANRTVPATKIQVSVLTGFERHFWPCPELFDWYGHAVVHAARLGVAVTAYRTTGYTTSQEARNAAVDAFLADPYVVDHPQSSYLVMIDNDHCPVHPVTGEMVNLFELAYSGLPIAAAPCSQIKQGDRVETNVYMLQGPLCVDDEGKTVDEEGRPIPPAKDGKPVYSGYRCLSLAELESRSEPFFPVDAVGFGAVAIRADVLIAVRDSKYGYVDLNDRVCFSTHAAVVSRPRTPSGETRYGEDLLFCRRAADLGFQSYVATGLYSGHWHTVDLSKIPYMQTAVSPDELQQRLNALTSDWGLLPQTVKFGPYTIEPELADFLFRTVVANSTRKSGRLGIHCILELGCGLSTLVLAAAMRRARSARHASDPYVYMTSYEESADWAERTDAMLKLNDLHQGGYSAILPTHLDPDTGFYDLDDMHVPETESPVDLLLVDGPKGDRPRIGAVEIIENWVRPGGLVVLDDYKRPELNEAYRQWVADGLLTPYRAVGRAMVCTRTGKDAPGVPGIVIDTP